MSDVDDIAAKAAELRLKRGLGIGVLVLAAGLGLSLLFTCAGLAALVWALAWRAVW